MGTQETDRPVVAFGPEMRGWGSWDWVGADLLGELRKTFRTASFNSQQISDADVVVLVKQAPHIEWMDALRRRAAVVYCPVDFYGSAAELDADGAMLRKCSRIVVHCERLRRYFEPYALVEYMDHHVKFAAPMRGTQPLEDGYLLWVGVRTNLPALADWDNAHPLQGELRILTNLEEPGSFPRPAVFGFRRDRNLRIFEWSQEAHLQMTAEARAALDIKGNDFRSRHKPPAKAIDFLASGVPLAMNADSSPVEHLARMGFEVASPLDTERWLSRAYWEETQRFGRALRELLSLERIGRRFTRIIEEVLAERR
jgi:hypothetical protein